MPAGRADRSTGGAEAAAGRAFAGGGVVAQRPRAEGSPPRELEHRKAKEFGGALICDAGGAKQRGNAPLPHGPAFCSPPGASSTGKPGKRRTGSAWR